MERTVSTIFSYVAWNWFVRVSSWSISEMINSMMKVFEFDVIVKWNMSGTCGMIALIAIFHLLVQFIQLNSVIQNTYNTPLEGRCWKCECIKISIKCCDCAHHCLNHRFWKSNQDQKKKLIGKNSLKCYLCLIVANMSVVSSILNNDSCCQVRVCWGEHCSSFLMAF